MADFYRGRRTILIGRPLPHFTTQVAALLRMGAAAPFVIANESGQAPAGIAGHCVVDLDMADPHTHARDTARFMADLPASVRIALDAYDPDRTALVLAQSAGAPSRMDGRLVADSGDEWRTKLADLTVLDELWDQLGAPRLPSSTVATETSLPAEAARFHDLGYGTLWQGQQLDGAWVPLASARLVPVNADPVPTAQWFAERASKVRISPIVAGTPCGVAGFVLPHGTVVLRPYEEITLDHEGELHYCGCSTYLDLPDEQHAQVTGLATAVGEELSRRWGFRGPFHISGLLVGTGYFPLDLVLRGGLGHALIESRLKGVSFGLFNAALAAGHDVGLSPLDVQKHLLPWLEEDRGAVIAVPTPLAPQLGTQTLWLTQHDSGLGQAGTGDQSCGCAVHVTSGRGGKLLIIAGPSFPRTEGRITAHAVDACAIAVQRWSTGFTNVRPVWRAAR
ncbi:hypothetical protein [Streptomyces anulatus]|uniref:hypothetical protein n=1 Tax=Streptomyces anulatus TaxID=1892 RepID=UPI0004CBB1A5|nr:hypothetical protein [Streptomyces anulatus]